MCIILLVMLQFYIQLLISPVAAQGQSESSPSTNLLSDLVVGIDNTTAGVLNFGNDLGRKVFPPDAYDFAEFAGRGLFFEAAAQPLSPSEKAELQSIIDQCPTSPPKASADFVTVQDGEFKFEGLKFQFLGFNSYQVIREELRGQNEVDNLFSRAQNLGLKVTRVWLFSDDIRRGPLDWDENVFVALDAIIQKAATYDIKIVFAFANFWEHFLGAEQYVWWAFGTLTGRNIQDFFVDSGVKQLYMAHVCKCINRVNTVTGIRWRDDPTIMAWNLMNEPRCPGCVIQGSRSAVTTQWITEMSTYIKSIDPNHLVTTGMEGFSTTEFGTSDLDNPGSWAICQGTNFISGHDIDSIDYATVHIYPEHNTWNFARGEFCDVECQINWSQQYYESRINEATTILNKPLVLEEFGMSIKFTYRVSQPDGSFFEKSYSTSERVDMYKRLLGTMLSAVNRGEHADGLMFWMAITNSYPDYDGFSILLDDTVSFEGLPPPDYNVLLQFRNQQKVEQCIAEFSNWTPNPINPNPLPITVQGANVNEILFDASQKLALTSPPIIPTPAPTPTPTPSHLSTSLSPSPSPSPEIVSPTPTPTPMIPSPTPTPSPIPAPTPTSGCIDVAPDNIFSCEQQRDFGKCRESWMLIGDFCKRTCGRCPCQDVAPDNKFTCEQQKDFGKCEASWMLEGDFCALTCGGCNPACVDVPPSDSFTCDEQRSFGQCEASWMLSGDFCKRSCGRC